MTTGLQKTEKQLKLSARELQVLALAARGITYAEISKRLAMSEDTAKDHIDRASKKLNTKNKTHTVAVALTLGFIELEKKIPPKVE